MYGSYLAGQSRPVATALSTSLVDAVGIGWGLGRATLQEQLQPGLPPTLLAAVIGWARYVVPLALAAILLGFVISSV
jgi:hypothetical protein